MTSYVAGLEMIQYPILMASFALVLIFADVSVLACHTVWGYTIVMYD